MAEYDIIQIEDDPCCFRFMESLTREERLNYLNLSSLNKLKKALPQISAKFWVIDGRFPEIDGGVVEHNFDRAVEIIVNQYPNARIGQYSATPQKSNLQGKIGIEYFDKTELSPGELVGKIKTIIKSN